MAQVKVSKLLKYSALIEHNTYMQIVEAQLKGVKEVYVSDFVLEELEKKKAAQKANEKLLARTAKLNTHGKELEKEGKIKQAIKVYERVIELGYPAHHAFKRLMVLYHKAKDYDNEVRVIWRAFDVFGRLPEYVERLKKVQGLI